MKQTLTVVVPSLNEEENIEAATRSILTAIGDEFEDYEILLFNDGSTDRTGIIIDKLSEVNPKIKAIHNKANRGVGYIFNRGVEIAKMEYLTILPGDNEVNACSIKEMFMSIGKADIVTQYIINKEVRSMVRRIVSSIYICIMNFLFRCDLRQYTGPTIQKKEVLKSIPLKTNDFAFTTAILVRLIRSGYSFIEVPIYLNGRTCGESKAFRIKNIIGVLWTTTKLFWELEILKKAKYNKFPVKRVVPYI